MAETQLRSPPAPHATGILPLRLEGVSYTTGGRTLVSDLSFELGAGLRTVLLGPNGAGKTIALRLCHGLIAPTAGTVQWLGPAAAQARAHQAMVFQRPVLLRRSALANVTYGLALRHVPRGERIERAMEALRQSGLAPLAQRQARVLSGGEQQRLALARAWALHPEVLFLDEPTANLDPGATREIENVIKAFDASGTKIIMSTHNLGQARRLGDEVLFIHQGRLTERAPVDRFFKQPASPEAAAFIKGELPWV